MFNRARGGMLENDQKIIDITQKLKRTTRFAASSHSRICESAAVGFRFELFGCVFDLGLGVGGWLWTLCTNMGCFIRVKYFCTVLSIGL